jgi:hypothetical protein
MKSKTNKTKPGRPRVMDDQLLDACLVRRGLKRQKKDFGVSPTVGLAAWRKRHREQQTISK